MDISAISYGLLINFISLDVFSCKRICIDLFLQSAIILSQLPLRKGFSCQYYKPIELHFRSYHAKRRSLKIQLKEYDDQIMVLKKEGRTALNLPEKLTVQKKIRDLDAKRNVAWKEYDEAAKIIEQQKDGLFLTLFGNPYQSV